MPDGFEKYKELERISGYCAKTGIRIEATHGEQFLSQVFSIECHHLLNHSRCELGDMCAYTNTRKNDGDKRIHSQFFPEAPLRTNYSTQSHSA